MKNFDYKNYSSYFFVGIGGISMSSLAIYLNEQGFIVAGSDISENESVKKLKKSKITVYGSHQKENIMGFEAVVYSSAIDENNPEIIEAKQRKIPLIKRAELLGNILRNYKDVIAVSGSHGKTTTTALISHVFKKHKTVTAFIGGDSVEYGNLISETSDVAVAEACEYKKNFYKIKPTVSVILNIDHDHVDCYKDINEEILAFKEFSFNSLTIKNADDKNSFAIPASITFGIKSNADFRAKNIKTTRNGVKFNLYIHKKRAGKIFLPLHGKHNVYNALATIAVATKFNVPLSKTATAIADFKGIKRRNEYLGNRNGVDFYADYAHHPEEIAKSLKTPLYKKNKTLVIFQPHTYSRTKTLMNDFIKALNPIKNLAVYKTYPAREVFDENGDGLTLAKNLNKSRKCNPVPYLDDIFKVFLLTEEGYQTVLILGAGNLYDEVKRLIK